MHRNVLRFHRRFNTTVRCTEDQKLVEQFNLVFKTHVRRPNDATFNVRDELRKCVDVRKPMILISGDQLTGKSSHAKRLAQEIGGEHWSVGTAFRRIAADRGISVGQLSKLLLETEDRSVDIDIDYRTCQQIGGAQVHAPIGVIDGRQPSIMGKYMELEFGKRNLMHIYFKCNVRERVVRFLQREVDEETARIADKHLPSFAEESIDSLPAARRAMSALSLRGADEVMRQFMDMEERDENDASRYARTYGVDYRDMRFYTLVIDTSDRSFEENFERLFQQLKPFLEEVKEIVPHLVTA